MEYNILDFGAKGDGVTDDSAAIQAAIDAAHAAGGGTVIIPAGIYIVSGDHSNPSAGAVEVRSNVSLVGAGMGETVLKLADNFNDRINGILRTPVNESAENILIKDLTIDGNRANNLGHQAGIITGVKTNADGRVHQNIVIDSVEAMNCTAYGINPHEITYNLIVRNSVSHGNHLDGFVADYVEGGLYENNISYGNDRHGFNATTSSNDVLFLNNISYGNGLGATGGTGIVIQRGDVFDGAPDIVWPTNITIQGGEYYGNSREGVLIKLSDDVTVTGVNIHDNARAGVRVEGSTDTLIENNIIHNNGVETPGAYDAINIRVRDDTEPGHTGNIYRSTNTRIIDNVITSNGATRYGIREEISNSTIASPSHTSVSGNTITNMTAGDYYIPATSATEGDDFLPGTSGADSFAGLGGNDVYVVNHSGDVVTELPNKGIDTVISHLAGVYTLTANVENLIIGAGSFNGNGNDLDNTITGNDSANLLKGNGGNDILDGKAGDDTLQGGAGNDTLIGGTGADRMEGGAGDDVYDVDNAGDVVVEKTGEGYDTVYSSVSYVLPTQVEKLVLKGTANLNATGNSGTNHLVGNTGNNVLDGGAGADTLEGGAGNDTYVVDHSGDVVIENANSGIDTVVSNRSYTLGAHVENLLLQGGDIDGTGNALANFIGGGSGKNILRGGAGDDILDGGAGVDRLWGGEGNDVFILRKGEIAGDIIEDFVGNGVGVGDRIVLSGFSSGATLTNVGGNSWKVTDGAHTEVFSIKTPAGEVAFDKNCDAVFENLPALTAGNLSDISGIIASLGTAPSTFASVAAATAVETETNTVQRDGGLIDGPARGKATAAVSGSNTSGSSTWGHDTDQESTTLGVRPLSVFDDFFPG
ncbi:glycosyl hydrolase family 28-related protein [Pseudochelatococcus lubricantis]|uniref:glycosyl hydrolase family 28-related protein n=1 Tax=Pseudochelatococcus lubricantis TaxID=1538102 RepID=UPI0035E8DA50